VSNPLQNRASDKPGTEEKISAILDLLGIIAKTLLRLFGKRAKDQ
jgi:hypothetical protein